MDSFDMDEEQVAELVADRQRQALEFIESGTHAKRKTISKINRGIIYQSIGEKCPICDLSLTEYTDIKSVKSYDPIDSSITIEHVLPLDLGGNNRLDNMVPMCYACNVKARCATQQYFVEAMVKENRGKTLSEEDKELLNGFVEWSIRTVKSPGNKIDSEIQQYFETVREILATEKYTLSPSISSGNPEMKIAELEKRIQALENTFWKRTMGAIGSFFQRTKAPVGAVEKSSIEKQAPQPQKRALAKKKALAKGKTPDFTAEEFVGGLLRHKKKDGEELFNNIYDDLIREESRYNLKKYNIKSSSYLEDNCSELLVVEKRLHKNGITSSHWISEKKDPVKIETSFDIEKVTPELDGVDEFKRIIKEIIDESDQKTVDGRHKLTISALGQRFSKRVQALGFDNKKEYFQQNGLDPTMSITKAISANFSEEEIEFAGEDIRTGSEFRTNLTHVVLNRRG